MENNKLNSTFDKDKTTKVEGATLATDVPNADYEKTAALVDSLKKHIKN